MIEENQLGDASVTDLAAALTRGAVPDLRELYLDCNQVGAAGLAALVAALQDGAAPQLTVLAVGCNPAGSAGEKSVQRILSERKRAGDRRGGDSFRQEDNEDRSSRT